jgi:7-carboxy-7-deazaguanine synthase
MYGDDKKQAEGAKIEKALTKKIAVIEMFGPTIQGEGPLAGSKTMFVRFGGCDYRCVKCDSLHAVIPEAVKKHATYMTQGEIADRIIEMASPSGTKWVTLSGGNPLMHNLEHLVERLQTAGLFVAVETQGSLYQPWLQKVNCLVLSPKSPGMGEQFEGPRLVNLLKGVFEAHFRPPVVALKIVIFSQQDIDFALDVADYCERAGFPFPDGLKYLSLGNANPPVLDAALDLEEPPVPEGLINSLLQDYRILIEEVCVDPRVSDWRFLPQLHVLAFGNEAGR